MKNVRELLYVSISLNIFRPIQRLMTYSALECVYGVASRVTHPALHELKAIDFATNLVLK